MNNQAAPQHRLQFLINDHPLPYNITIYQAVRQYGLLAPASAAAAAGAETDTDNETVGALGYAAIWDNTYSLSYRLLPSGDPADGNASGKEIFEGTSKRKHSSGSSRSSKSPKHDTLWHGKQRNNFSLSYRHAPVRRLGEGTLGSSRFFHIRKKIFAHKIYTVIFKTLKPVDPPPHRMRFLIGFRLLHVMLGQGQNIFQ